MGWLALFGIGVIAAGVLLALGVPRMAWTSVGAALMLAVAGYSLQGRPDLPGHLAVPSASAVAIEPDDLKLRDEMFGAYHNGTAFLGATDALLRAGETRTASRAALGGVQEYPSNIALWTELGLALTAADGGNLSPAASFAFDRAVRLAPLHPGPRYFLGVAYLQGGQIAATRAQWQMAYRLTPPEAPYRAKLAERLRLLDQFMERMQKAQAQAQRQ